MTNNQIRELFWQRHPQFDRNVLLHDYGIPTFPTDVRTAFIDFMYSLHDDEYITRHQFETCCLTEK